MHLALLTLLACRSDARRLCSDLLACAEDEPSWVALDANERVGRNGSCWDEGEEICFDECRFAYWRMPIRVRDTCPVDWASYGLIGLEEFEVRFLELYCAELVACGDSMCLEGGDVFPDTCAFDAESALACLDGEWVCEAGFPVPPSPCLTVCG